MRTVNIFLDDLRDPKEAYAYTKNPVYLEQEWVVVRNHKQFCNRIKDAYVAGEPLGIVSFDHDLAQEHYQDLMVQSGNDKIELNYDAYEDKTGYDCLNWLLDFCSNEGLRRPVLLLHTMNPVGKDNMRNLIANKRHR